MKKRILSILLTLCMALALCPVVVFAEEPFGAINGDINGDGVVSIYDAIFLQNYLEGFENLNDDQLIVADFNGDGVVNYSDFTELQSHLELPESSITVTNGKAAACGTDIGKAALYTRVTLTADSPSDNMVFDKWIVNEGGVTLADASSPTTVFAMPEDPVSVTATYKLLSTSETGSLSITVGGFQVGNTPNDITLSFESTIPGITFDEEDIGYLEWREYVFTEMGNPWEPKDMSEAFEADTRYQIMIELDNKGLDTAPAVTVNGKTPEFCQIATREGVPVLLQIACEFDAPPKPSQYTITYDGGEEAEGSVAAGVKTHGEDFTLSSDTFTLDGFVQTGWMDEYYNEYKLGGTYTLDEDMTFYPIFEKLVIVTADFTTTVALGDVGEPGETTFDLALIGDSAPDLDKSDVTVSGSVITNGKGDYDGTLTITGPEQTLWYMLSEGAFVQQVDDGADGWTVDDTVYGLRWRDAAELATDDTAEEISMLILPAICEEDDDGVYYYLDWDADPLDKMTFTNTYTAHAYELKHNATHHWDECGCGDVQNKELHKYGAWKVTKEATQTAKGEKEHTCTVCGYTEKTEIEKLPATTEPTVPDTEPTDPDTDPTEPTDPDTDPTDPTNPDTEPTDSTDPDTDPTDSTDPDTDMKPDTTTPETGDSSHMALWFALLFVSGAGVIGTTVYGKKKRAK